MHEQRPAAECCVHTVSGDKKTHSGKEIYFLLAKGLHETPFAG